MDDHCGVDRGLLGYLQRGEGGGGHRAGNARALLRQRRPALAHHGAEGDPPVVDLVTVVSDQLLLSKCIVHPRCILLKTSAEMADCGNGRAAYNLLRGHEAQGRGLAATGLHDDTGGLARQVASDRLSLAHRRQGQAVQECRGCGHPHSQHCFLAGCVQSVSGYRSNNTQRQGETTRQRQKHDGCSRGRTWTRSRSPSLFRSRSSTSHIQASRLSWSSVVADAASSITSSGVSDWSVA